MLLAGDAWLEVWPFAPAWPTATLFPPASPLAAIGFHPAATAPLTVLLIEADARPCSSLSAPDCADGPAAPLPSPSAAAAACPSPIVGDSGLDTGADIVGISPASLLGLALWLRSGLGDGALAWARASTSPLPAACAGIAARGATPQVASPRCSSRTEAGCHASLWAGGDRLADGPFHAEHWRIRSSRESA